MAETFVCPSELHLKKELSAVRKARFLRDPETCSSWRSPLASRSISAFSGLRNADDIDLEPNCVLTSRIGSSAKKVYLYNWVHHSRKSSDSGIKMDGENKEGSAWDTPGDSPVNPRKVEDKDNTLLEEPLPDSTVKRTRHEIPMRKSVRKLRRSPLLKHRNLSTYRTLNSSDHSEDAEYCNSGDMRRSTQELIRKNGYVSSPASPLISGSGCGNWSISSRVLRTAGKDESSNSVTPVSTSSIDRNRRKNPSSVVSWDVTSVSYDGEEVKPAELLKRRGSRIPRSSSKRVKDRGCGGWYSPSLSDTLKRKGTSILCGSQTLYQKRKSPGVRRKKFLSRASHGLPLLTNGVDEDQSLMDTASDDLSTNLGELDLEALSRLDGRRWSNCKSQEDLGIRHRSLSQKYRPRSFDEIIGQNIVVQSLHNAILKGRIAPAYLFNGPRGTGKTSTARIFAAALNCLGTAENKPCGACRECADFASGNGLNIRELDAADKKGIDRIRNLLKNIHKVASSSRYKVFIIDECHVLPSKVWSTLIKFLEEPPLHSVFLLVTINPDKLPRAILSRCQKYLFPKIKDADIVRRLGMLSSKEGLDVELDALGLIALNSDGSLRDAETILDQLSLLGRRITASLVNDLKLLDLLEIAMSSDTAETVKSCRELLDSGVDPMALMSQLAGVIMDIIAGIYRRPGTKSNETVLRGRSLTNAEVNRLQQALRILSDAEKQLRLSSERSTWFTAALLQLGCGHSPEVDHTSGTSSSERVRGTPAVKTSDVLQQDKPSCSVYTPSMMNAHCSPYPNPSCSRPVGEKIRDLLPTCSNSGDGRFVRTTCKDKDNGESFFTKICPEKLDEIWRVCIEKCHSKTLRQLLSAHGQLLSISEAEAFDDEGIKNRAEGYLSSITNSMEMVLRQHVRVGIRCVPGNFMGSVPLFADSTGEQSKTGLRAEERRSTDDSDVYAAKDLREEFICAPRKSADNAETRLRRRTPDICEGYEVPNASVNAAGLLLFSSRENGKRSCKEETKEEMALRTRQKSGFDEQRLESVWAQTMEKTTPGSEKPVRNQILPQNGRSRQHWGESMLALPISSKHWEDELNQEIKALKISDAHHHLKEPLSGRAGAISPSVFHKVGFPGGVDRESR
ncbi:unnamed protein product [Spirodela intermedia]|uniref:AAA+ ATPase domain-containing protein n=1 Tax=Spirodela intermedia TaxID=51605 RepID=A0A7I8IWR3_SPIIN|nr:unnamed protein product [Spirodela intermedia]CAA6662434.1 unnamed protein product [Spirodela intermedia]